MYIYKTLLRHISVSITSNPLQTDNSYLPPWINNNTDAGLHVVIELVGKHIYTMTLCVCVFMYAKLLRPVL